MASVSTHHVSELAKAIYATRLQAELEPLHPNEFVAIEPESGNYLLGASFSDAVAASRSAYPNRISFVIRIGHLAAVHIGAISN